MMKMIENQTQNIIVAIKRVAYYKDTLRGNFCIKINDETFYVFDTERDTKTVYNQIIVGLNDPTCTVIRAKDVCCYVGK